ncbi:MAG: hypothetical protein Q9160_001841 [Pyrenula sp. 1 TL-2023]
MTSSRQSSTNPFALAISSFISDLKRSEDAKTPFYKEVLTQINNTPPGLDLTSERNQCADRLATFVHDLERRQKRDSKTRWVTEKLRPLMSGLDQYTRICDLAIQAAPSAAMLLYSGARLVLQLGQSFNSCFDTILSILEDIGHLLQCYHLFSTAYQSSVDMQNQLVESYKNIIIFWQRASRLLGRKAYKTLLVGIVKSLSAEWQICRQRLHDDSERVKMLAQATEAAMRGRKDLEQTNRRQSKVRREIVDWIKACEDEEALDVRQSIHTNIEIRHENTCEWLFEHPSMAQWLNAKKTIAIWHNAPPGAGKTILASSVARRLQDKGLRTVVFFCSFNDMALRKPITAFRCLALQLLTLSDTVPDKVLRLYEEDVKHHCFQLKDIKVAVEVVEGLLKQLSRVHIIIDGLDECEDRSELVKYMSRLLQTKTYGIVKWFMSSRSDHEIRNMMIRNEILEIEGTQESRLTDIKRYVTDTFHARLNHTCEDCIERWTSDSEGNFLWVTLMLKIIEGEDLTCEEEIEEQLSQFPKGLTGAYVRTLTQLSKRPERQQQLARRIFAILVTAAQPLHLSELSHALAMGPGQVEFPVKRIPRLQLIEELCSNLFIFDRNSKGSESDPLIKIAHKSIQEFFQQDPYTLEIPQDLRHYFVSRSASLEIGSACLQYLNLSRYQLPQDIESILENEDHAFLRHAATFWHYYLNNAKHSKQLFEEVEAFVQSQAFWTCLAIQARAAPHLFACYIKDTDCGHYKMDIIAPCHEEENVSYAFPLPEWLENYQPSGSKLIQSFHAFVRAWHPMLTLHPAALDQCVMGEPWEAVMLGRKEWLSDRVNAFDLSPEQDWSLGFQTLCVINVKIDTDLAEVSLLGSYPSANRWILRMIYSQFDSNTGSLLSDPRVVESDSQNIPPNNLTSSGAFARNEPFWLIDPNSLHTQQLTITEKDSLEVLETKFTASPLEPIGGNWKLVSRASSPTFDTESPSENQTVVALHLIQEALHHDSDALSRHDSALDSSSSRTPSLLEFSSDSGVGSDESSLKESATRNCLLIAQENELPKWHFWNSSAESPRVEVLCATHPTKHLAVWSPSTHEICIMHLPTGHLESTILPEPADIQLSSATAMRKELRFSPSGELLHYLLYAVEEYEGSIHSKLSVSTFQCSVDNDKDVALQQIHSTPTLTYKCDGALRYPLMLSSWTPDHLYIALPQLYCKPTILRLPLYSLENEDDEQNASSTEASAAAIERGGFETLRDPIYFPATTPNRNPQLKLHSRSSGNNTSCETLLTLTLDAEISPKSSNTGAPTTPTTPTIRTPPQLLTSNLSPSSSTTTTTTSSSYWVPYTQSISDSHNPKNPNNLKNPKPAQGTYEMLRGSFVDTDQRFNVPVRSGLDWTRKAFLSCA